jgi:RNA polymerase sigma factor for flagellar operon FliA
MAVTEYYVLARQIARREYARLPRAASVGIELQDLEQEAYIGLIQAAQRFDPARGIAFRSYAQPRITGAVLDSLRREDILPEDRRREVRELAAVEEDLRKQLGQEPGVDELSAVTGKTPAEIREIKARSVRIVPESSLAPGEGEESLSLEEMAAVRPGQGADLLGRDVDDCVDEVLPEVERRVICYRFLGEELTLATIGEMLGRPLPTVFNISQRAQQKLKDCLEGKGWGVDDALGVL